MADESVDLCISPFIPKKYSYSAKSDFFREGNELTKVYERQFAIYLDDEKLLHNNIPEFCCGKSGCSAKFDSVHAYEIHYKRCHFHICLECNREFPSESLLDCHIEEKHDSYRKTASTKLYNPYTCIIENCCDKFQNISDRNEHLIKIHKYPPNYKFSDLKTRSKNEKMDISENDMGTNAKFEKSYTFRLPDTICFGRNSSRGFHRGMKKPSVKTSKRKVTDITMKELKDAL